MKQLNIRNVPDDVHRALRVRAANRGRSLEAELRQIVADAVGDAETPGIGTRLKAFGQRFGGIDIEEVPGSPVNPAEFS